MAVSVMASAETVDKKPAVSELTDGGKYYIYDSNSGRYSFFRDMDSEGLSRITGKHILNTAAYGALPEGNYIWTATKNEAGQWQFQNVATGHYIGDSNNASATPGSFNVTTYPNQTATNVFSVQNVTTSRCWDANLPSDAELSYWTAPGHPFMFYSAVQGEDGNWNFDATINYQVTVNYQINGTTISTQTHTGVAGTTYTLTLPAFTTTTEELTRTFASDETLNISVTEALPFRASTVENPVWQAWFMHSTYSQLSNRYSLTYITDDEETNVTGFRNNISTAHPDEELWAFVGDVVNGFKIYNKAAGIDKALKKADPMATLVPADEATLWTLAASRVNPDQTKYFVFKADGTCANMQWKNGNGVIKYWADSDQGSTCWVEGVSQPLVNYYANTSFNTARPTINGVVGDYIDEETAENTIALAQQGQNLVNSLDAWTPIADEQLNAIAEIQAQVAGAPRVEFNPAKCCYRLYSFQYNGYMVLNEENNLMGQGTADDANGLVSLIPAATEGKYYMLIANKYFAPVGTSSQVGTVDTTEGAGEFTVTTADAPFHFVFKGGDNDYTYLHEAGGHNIVGWETAAPSTKWYLVPTDTPTSIREVATEATAAEGIYDLQGRRVAAPAAGIYIINRRKVVVK